MGVKLDQKSWDAIEVAYFKGQSANSLAKEYGVSEAAIRKRLKGKKADKVEDAVVKVVEARKAVEALPAILRPHVDSLAEARLEITELQIKSSTIQSQNNLALVNMVKEMLATIDPADPDKDILRFVHGLIETANKAAWQPLELLKASKGMETAEQGAQMTLPVPVYKITHE